MFSSQDLVFAASKNIKLNSTHYFVMKIPNRKELQQIPFNYLSDIDFQNFMNFYKQCTAKFDITLASEDSSPLRKSLLERI